MKLLFVILYVIGLIAILVGVVFAWTRFRKKHYVPEFVENILGFVLLVVVCMGGYIVLDKAKNEIIEEYVKTQDTFCLNSTREDGTELTDAQCQYFHDVMNGKYSTYDPAEEYYEELDRDPY